MSDTFATPWALLIGSSFAFSGLFYHLYQEKKKEIVKLKEIPKFQPDNHLLKILKASPHHRLQYVAVEGVIQPDGDPIASQYVPKCFGVVQKVIIEENWKVWNSITNKWTNKTMNQKVSNNAVPFSLVSPGSYIPDTLVKVQSPLQASGDFLELVFKQRKLSQGGVVDAVLQGVSGERPVSRDVREEMLTVGTPLTAFGEVVLEYGEKISIHPPRDGRTYVLMVGDHRSFIERHEGTAGWWKALSAFCGITGSAVLAGVIYDATKGHGDRRK
ncbi:mitochondrial ubiquitin ligase activator of nfkb 1-A [Engraulis encrasicolus]|uniref:mitochondrial ubiquitin ligase activator of nfkb 1-A n=1 Tax=Engraulis encrasicolus TaxID=184585 RepID=UPI002FD3BD01